MQITTSGGQSLNVRFGSKADIGGGAADVRFTPESGHWNSVCECPLCANSGHCCRIEIIRKCMVDRQDERKADNSLVIVRT